MTASADLRAFYAERVEEIDEYLRLLHAIEVEASTGVPRLEKSQARISVTQQRILSSSLYLQLYNLTEAIVTRCLSFLEDSFKVESWKPSDLDPKLRREWVRYIARTHDDLAPDRRLASAMEMCDHLVGQLPLGDLKISAGGGGNWDDEEVYRLSERVGCNLVIQKSTTAAVKRPLRDGLGAMKLVKNRRNGLAHGSISFKDCADQVTADELEQVAVAIKSYLQELLDSFIAFANGRVFLLRSSRPSELSEL